jgi:hypothetical protein
MTPEAAISAYRRALNLDNLGEPVEVRRYTGTAGPDRPYFDATVIARVTDYQPSDLVGDIRQGDRHVILMQEDLIAAQFPMPVRQTDKIVVRGKECAIEKLDDSTRRIGTTLIAYEARVKA